MRLPTEGQTFYARSWKGWATNRMIVLHVGTRTIRVRHLRDDGTPILAAHTSHPPKSFTVSYTFAQWSSIRPHWKLTTPTWAAGRVLDGRTLEEVTDA